MAINEENKIEEKTKSISFVEQLVEEDLKEGKNAGRIQTRFPPEPNGYLHIGHAKAICMDFGVAEKYKGVCNLRFDDTNPSKENNEYVENILQDIQWLGFKWGNIYYASDYFEKLWEFAVWMIKKGHAYVDEQTAEEIAAQKGTPTTPGTASPYRDRPIEESLALFEKMNTPEAVEGSMVLRAKLDMANPNMHFRDPIMYRIIQTPHHRTGTKWHAYPMYDFAHGQSDYFEGVTHSICTLEFVPHRPLYDKFVDFLKEMDGSDDVLNDNRPRQIEFNRLNLTYTVMSKRKLHTLVDEHLVNGWDDPRMPTLCGMRRRGYSPESIRMFIDSIGYTKFDALNDMALLEASVREDLNKKACRVSAVLDPVKLVITNYPEGESEEMEAINNPENEADGTHTITFSKNLWIERADFMEDAPKKFFRMTPGKEVRLKNAYIVKCTGCTKDENGVITEIQAEYDPISKSGMEGANRKVKGTLHWVSADHCVKAEVREYDRLFAIENPSADERDFRELLNPESFHDFKECYVEEYAATKKPGEYLQFQRIGYFMADLDTSIIMNTADLFLWILDNLNYWVVALFMAIESSFIPFPSEVVVPPAAWKAMDPNSGMSFILVIVFATIGADLGALINYYLAKWVGRPIIYRFADSRIGHMCLIDRQKVEVAEEYFRKHGAASTIFGRLVPAVRQLISIPAGLAGMHVGKFLLYTTIGAGVWNTVLAAIGWGIYEYTDYKTTHDVYQQAVQYSHEIGYVILALAVVVVAFIAYKGIKKK